MSLQGPTGPTRALLGSVADAVALTAHRPVLLIRQQTELPKVIKPAREAVREPHSARRGDVAAPA
jgi:hypothetical protein